MYDYGKIAILHTSRYEMIYPTGLRGFYPVPLFCVFLEKSAFSPEKKRSKRAIYTEGDL
jgi:hypothetical protein